jgi:putative peptidoglycan lipid II flippase
VIDAITSKLRRFIRADAMVAAGILASRLAGFVRTSTFSYFFGLKSEAADAFNAAFRIPNLLQNLFGEGALSGSFIPVYTGLRVRAEDEAAAQTARTFFVLLSVVIAVLVLVGMLAAPWITPLLVPGFQGHKRELTIRLVRLLFPGAGLLVASAWCLGVLNSHGKFLLSYTAPVAWNAAMIVTLLVFGRGRDLDTLAVYLAWGSVVGSFLQLAVQWPFARSLTHSERGMALSEPVRQIGRNFIPITISRGAVQLTGYIDQYIASFLPTGAVTGLSNAQQLYTLPVSLFGISVSAAELPALSQDVARQGDNDPSQRLAAYEPFRVRMNAGLLRLAFFIVPSAVAFVGFGDVIAGALLQHGRFKPEDSRYVWGILAGSSIGLLASTMARLYSVAHYALGDAKRPLRFAFVRLAVAGGLGYVCALVLPPYLGIGAQWGAAGLTASAGVAGWIEFALLRSSLNARIGSTGLPASYVARLWTAGLVAAAIAWGVRLVLPPLDPILRGGVVLPVLGGTYLGMTAVLGVPMPGFRRR